jgi:hypothetical protein
MSEVEWCPGEDSNLQRIAPAATSRRYVYQFRHPGIFYGFFLSTAKAL